MPILTPHQSSFASGYLSPKLQGRVDLEQYYAGLLQSTNWAIHPQGPIQRRNGTQYIDNCVHVPPEGSTILDPYADALFFPFYYGFAEPIVVVFTTNKIRYYYKGGFIQTGHGETNTGDYITPTNQYQFTADKFKWMDCTQVDGHTMIIVSPHCPPLRLICSQLNIWQIYPMSSFYECLKDQPKFEPLWSSCIPKKWGWNRNECIGAGSDIHIGGYDYKPDEDVLGMRATTGYNWPTRCCMYEQRLVLASSELYPQLVTMSRVGEWTDFRTESTITVGDTTETRVLDTDGIEFNLATGTDTFISWLLPASSLIIGTLEGEYKCGGASGEAITPNNIKVSMQSTFGACEVRAKMAGSDAAFVTKNRKSLIMYTFNYLTDSWEGSNACVFADDLCNVGIRNITVQSTPMTIVWVVLEDGRLAKYTYDKKQKLSYWTVYEFGGKVKSAYALPTAGDDELLLFIERNIRGGTDKQWNNQFERMAPEVYDIYSPAQAKCVDSHLEYSGPPANYFLGLDNLIGKSVYAISNGLAYGPYTVDENGGVHIGVTTTHCYIGLPFKSRFVTTNIHSQDKLTVANEKTVFRADFYLDASGGLVAGLIPHTVRDYKNYNPDWADLVSRRNLFTGIKRVNLFTHAEYEWKLCVQTTGADPSSILGIKTYMEVN